MSKQSIYVKHKDEIFLEYKRIVEVIMENYENGMNRDYTQGKKEALEWVLGLDKSYESVNKDYFDGYIDALKWVLGLDKTQEEKEKEFSDKIDALTNKGENNDSSNK
jgi:hypothetical protein